MKSPVQVAKRVVACQLFLTRWAIEGSVKKDAFDTLQNAISCLKSNVFTRAEMDLLKKPLGSWQVEELFNASINWERLGILLYSIEIFKETPSPGVLFPRNNLYQATSIIPAYPETIDTFLEYFENGPGSNNHFITREKYSSLVDQTEAWYWRVKAQKVLDIYLQLQEDSEDSKKLWNAIPPGLMKVVENIPNAIEQASLLATERGYANCIKGDFDVEGKPYAELDDHSMRDLGFGIEARLATLKWISGHDWEYELGNVEFLNPMGSLFSPENEKVPA